MPHDPDITASTGVLEHLLELVGGGGFLVDGSGLVTHWSAKAAATSGVTGEDAVGGPVTALCDDGRRLVDLKQLLSARPSQTGTSCRFPLRGSDGAVWCRLHLIPDDSAYVGVLSTGDSAAERRDSFRGFIGSSALMQEVYRRIGLAAASDVTTLLTGESGTGKELVARSLHLSSQRRPTRAFLRRRQLRRAARNRCSRASCSATPRARSPARMRDKPGLFQLADGAERCSSTRSARWASDAAGQVPPRRSQDARGPFPVGGTKPPGRSTCDFVAATNRDLRERVASGEMREDFFYRIRVFEIALPPLRDRLEDVPMLAEHFVGTVSGAWGKTGPRILPDAMARLLGHPWPGNVRELRNAIEHALVTATGEGIHCDDLPADICKVEDDGPGDDSLEAEVRRAERDRIVAALDAHDWNRTLTAKHLGISRVTLWKKMRRYEIDEGIFRRG